MDKQELARVRNWQKRRLMGFCLNSTALTTEEIKIYADINVLISTLCTKWDKNTEEKLGIKLKPYKCYWCGRRSNIKYEVEEDTGRPTTILCKKHFEYYEEEERIFRNRSRE